MPRVEPEPSLAGWDPCEGTIGVVGVAPWATLDFCRAVYSLVDAEKDWHYPRLLIDANAKIPSRGRYLELGERDPSPLIRETIDELAEQGATVVAVPCNTAHLLYDRWASGARVAVPNLIEVTADRVAGWGGRRVVVLASRLASTARLYGEALDARGVEELTPGAELQERVSALIEEVKRAGGNGPAARAGLEWLLTAAIGLGADAVILGCTELGAVHAGRIDRSPIPVIDSNQELARFCLGAIGARLREERVAPSSPGSGER